MKNLREYFEPTPPTLKCGQLLADSEGELYILSSVAMNKISLIALDDGNRWSDPVRVEKILEITSNDMAQLVGDLRNWSVVPDKETFIERTYI